jgi:hypothetical protein
MTRSNDGAGTRPTLEGRGGCRHGNMLVWRKSTSFTLWLFLLVIVITHICRDVGKNTQRISRFLVLRTFLFFFQWLRWLAEITWFLSWLLGRRVRPTRMTPIISWRRRT